MIQSGQAVSFTGMKETQLNSQLSPAKSAGLSLRKSVSSCVNVLHQMAERIANYFTGSNKLSPLTQRTVTIAQTKTDLCSAITQLKLTSKSEFKKIRELNEKVKTINQVLQLKKSLRNTSLLTTEGLRKLYGNKVASLLRLPERLLIQNAAVSLKMKKQTLGRLKFIATSIQKFQRGIPSFNKIENMSSKTAVAYASVVKKLQSRV